jgi:hypothetical protein
MEDGEEVKESMENEFKSLKKKLENRSKTNKPVRNNDGSAAGEAPQKEGPDGKFMLTLGYNNNDR